MTELHQASVATGSESTCGLSIDQSLAEKPEAGEIWSSCFLRTHNQVATCPFNLL